MGFNAGLPAGYMNESLMRQQLKLREREAELKERMRETRTAAPPQGRMVSGHYVSPHWTQQLAPVAAQIAGEFQKRGLEADQTGYDAIEMAEVKRHMDAIPPEDAPQAAKLQWAEKGKQIPALLPYMTDYAKDQLIAAPERAAQREARKDLATQTQTERAAAQQRDHDFKREQREEQQAFQAEQNQRYRRTTDQLARVAGINSGGFKANDFVTSKDGEGNVVIINKLTREVHPVGAVGTPAGAIIKDKLDQYEKRQNAAKALEQLDEAERLLPQATGSKVGALRDTLYSAAGLSTKASQAAAQLDALANNVAANIPRMAGQVSDADLLFLQKQAGDLANRDLPSDTRLAALRQVRKVMRRAASGQSAAPAQSPAGPSIRQAVENAAQSKSVDDLLNKYK